MKKGGAGLPGPAGAARVPGHREATLLQGPRAGTKSDLKLRELKKGLPGSGFPEDCLNSRRSESPSEVGFIQS